MVDSARVSELLRQGIAAAKTGRVQEAHQTLLKVTELDDDHFDEVKGDADSIAGLILELMEKMPEKDEKVSYKQFIFTVKAVDKRRIKRVLVTISIPEAEPDFLE